MKKRSIYDAIKKFPEEDLKKMYRKENDGRMRTRLQALYHLKNGMELHQVVDVTLASEVSIRRWCFLYAERGYVGLLEEDGRGRYPKLPKEKNDEFVEDVQRLQQERDGGRVIGKDIQKLLQTKYQIDYTLRSVYVLLDRMNFSWISCRSQHPRCNEEAINAFKKDFPDIAAEVTKELSTNKIEIWWQDEMRIGQQGSLSRIWALKGTRPRVVRQRQFLSAYIFGACCPQKDKSCALILPDANSEMMQLHLLEISKNVAKNHHALVLLDRAGWHMTEQMQIPSNISFIPLPPYSPELNPMEQLWQQLRKIKLSNACYETYDDIVNACCDAWNMFSKEEGAVRKLCSRNWAKIHS